MRYDHDVVVEGSRIRKRKKGPPKALKEEFGHTPLTAAEEIPWSAPRLWIGTGAHGRLPVGEDLRERLSGNASSVDRTRSPAYLSDVMKFFG